MTQHWMCLTCDESGSYEPPGTKTDTGPAVKHGHATLESTDPDALAGMRDTIAKLAAAQSALAACREVAAKRAGR